MITQAALVKGDGRGARGEQCFGFSKKLVTMGLMAVLVKMTWQNMDNMDNMDNR